MFENAMHLTMYFALHEAVATAHLSGGSAIAFCLVFLMVLARTSVKKPK